MATFSLLEDPGTGHGIRCLVCGRISRHPEDVSNRYCGSCRQFHPIPTLDSRQLAQMIHGVTSMIPRPDGTCVEPWQELSDDARQKAVAAVETLLASPAKSPKELHDVWMGPLLEEGWTPGPYDRGRKTHPCIVPYDELPINERLKDMAWSSLIELFRPHTKA